MRDPEEMRGSHRSNGGATGTSSQKAGAFALYSRYGILLTVVRRTAHGWTAYCSQEHVMANPIVDGGRLYCGRDLGVSGFRS